MKVNNNGLIKVIILDNLSKVLNMVKENIFGMMDQIMMVNGIKEKFMVRVFIDGKMEVLMMVVLIKDWGKDLEKCCMKIKNIMRANFIKIKKKVMVF